MILYRYRPIGSALLEIENGTFHFASREELNDPIEGYVRVFWKGDQAAWEGLFRNYICSLKQALDLYRLRGDEQMLRRRTLLVDLHRFDEVPLGEILQSLGDRWVASPEIKRLASFYGEHHLKVCDGELQMVLQVIHNQALCLCIQQEKEAGLMDEEADLLLEQFASQKTAFPEQLWENVLTDEKQRAAMSGITGRAIEDLRELQYIRMGLQQKLSLYGNSAGDFREADEKAEAAFQRRKWLSVAVDFPRLYMEQLKEMIYPESYVICFSERNDNSAMWGNYAENHRGVCLVYETDESNGIRIGRRREDFRSQEAMPVRYDGDTLERNFFETFGRLNRKQIRTWLTGADGKVSSAMEVFSDEEEWRKWYWEVFQAKIYQKIPAWSHEQEYRIALDNMFGEFMDPADRNLFYAPEHFRGVIFGVNTSEQDKKRIMEKLLARAGQWSDLKFYQAEYDDEKRSIFIREKLFWELKKKNFTT